jgi:hypothetical protein
VRSWEESIQRETAILRSERQHHDQAVYDVTKVRERLKYRREVAAMLANHNERRNIEFLWQQADSEGMGHITVYEYIKVR